MIRELTSDVVQTRKDNKFKNVFLATKFIQLNYEMKIQLFHLTTPAYTVVMLFDIEFRI